MNFGFSKKKVLIVLGIFALWVILVKVLSSELIVYQCIREAPCTNNYQSLLILYEWGCDKGCVTIAQLLKNYLFFGLIPLGIIYLIYSLVEKK